MTCCKILWLTRHAVTYVTCCNRADWTRPPTHLAPHTSSDFLSSPDLYRCCKFAADTSQNHRNYRYWKDKWPSYLVCCREYVWENSQISFLNLTNFPWKTGRGVYMFAKHFLTRSQWATSLIWITVHCIIFSFLKIFSQYISKPEPLFGPLY